MSEETGSSWRIGRDDAVLVVIDVQEKLMARIHCHEEVEENIVRLVRGFGVLGIPVVATEQYPQGIGPTTAPVREACTAGGGWSPIEKMCFSGVGCLPFRERLDELDRREIILCGIETHVCVYQTAMDLLEQGFGVTLVRDAVSSRSAANRDVALQRMSAAGARLSSTEMILFELTVESGTDQFRTISKLVK